MPNPEAVFVVQRIGQIVAFANRTASEGGLVASVAPFGQLLTRHSMRQ